MGGSFQPRAHARAEQGGWVLQCRGSGGVACRVGREGVGARCTRVNLMSRESHAAGWGREKWSGRTEIPHHHGRLGPTETPWGSHTVLVRVRKGKGTGVPGTRSSPPASSPVVDWYPYHGDTTKSLQEEGKGRNSRPGAPEHTLLLCPMSKMCVFKNYTTV